MSQSILVTGGAGYIGSHACKALARAGYRPVVYDNLSRGHREAVRWGPLVEGDIADSARLGAAIKEHAVTAVMHFAAYAYVGESVGDPALYYHNNLCGSLSLLEAMRQTGIGEIVFSSTCATYGTPDTVPIRETATQRPVNPYGETKLAIERALHWYGQAYGIRSVSLRYFNAAGADRGRRDRRMPRARNPSGPACAARRRSAGAPPSKSSAPIIRPPTAPRSATTSMSTTSPTPICARSSGLRAGGDSIALNLGTGRGHSVREVIAAAEAVSGRRIPVRDAPRRPGDPPALVADPGLAAETLGWQAQHSDLDTIIRTALAWHRRSNA